MAVDSTGTQNDDAHEAIADVLWEAETTEDAVARLNALAAAHLADWRAAQLAGGRDARDGEGDGEREQVQG